MSQRILSYTTGTTRTGGALCFSLRPDMFEGAPFVDGAARFNQELGCLDAPRCLPGGPTTVEDSLTFRHVSQRLILRPD